MRIVCVAGGSYKSFYLNRFLKLNKCDLIVFNFGIFYNINSKSSNKAKLIFQEIRDLSDCKNCVVVAGVVINYNSFFVVCKNKAFKIYPSKYNVKLKVKDKVILITKGNTFSSVKNKIIFTNCKRCVNIKACSPNKNYIFIHDYGIDIVKNRKLKRNFNKCLNFILK